MIRKGMGAVFCLVGAVMFGSGCPNTGGGNDAPQEGDNGNPDGGTPFDAGSSPGAGGSTDAGTTSACGWGFAETMGACAPQWVESYLKASNAGTGDRFGTSVALSKDGMTLAVGAIKEASDEAGVNGAGANNNSVGSGAVYVFIKQAGTWVPQEYLKAANAEMNDEFGYSVALSADGNTLAVGAIFEDSNATGVSGSASNNAAAGSGAVYVFVRNAGLWSQQAYVKATNTDANDAFGISLALSADGNTLAVGADGEASNATGVGGNQDDDSASFSGAIYVYARSGTTWAPQAYLKASNTDSLDGFGFSVSLSDDGNVLAGGAPYESSNAIGVGGDGSNNDAAESGAVYVFQRTGSAWSAPAYLKAENASAGSRFGRSVSLSGDGLLLAVGAHEESSEGKPSSGFAYVFSLSGGQWLQTAGLKPALLEAEARFGNSVSLSTDGRTLAVGAAWESEGTVYVFSRVGSTWPHVTRLKAANADMSDRFGNAVALSGDGNTLAIGAWEESSSATSVGGDGSNNDASKAGAAYVFQAAP